MASAIMRDGILCYKGSNCLRQRLVLSVLSGKSIRITHIRTLENEPGLKEFEISLVRLLDKITNGTIVEINETGTAIYFQPGLLYGGHVEHECSTERSIGYYLEALVMLGLFCKKPINAILRGVTSGPLDPSVDLINASMLNVLKKFIVDDEGLGLKINKRGMLPLGGGEVFFKCPIINKLKPVQLLDGGLVKRIRGVAYALRVSPTMANRMVERAKGVLLNFLPDVYINTDQCRGQQSGKSPGFGINLVAETTNGTLYSAEHISNVVVNGDSLSLPEEVAEKAAKKLLNEVYLGGITDSTCQAVAILCMALGPQDVSKIVIGHLAENTIRFIRHLKEFFDTMFHIESYRIEDGDLEGRGCPDKVLLTCVGIGYKNINKRTI